MSTIIPSPPDHDPRANLSTTESRRFVAPGEYVKLTARNLRTDPVVRIDWPSGYVDIVPFEVFETVTLPQYLNKQLWWQQQKVLSYLTNWRRIVFWPHEDQHRIRVRDPQGKEIFA